MLTSRPKKMQEHVQLSSRSWKGEETTTVPNAIRSWFDLQLFPQFTGSESSYRQLIEVGYTSLEENSVVKAIYVEPKSTGSPNPITSGIYLNLS